MMVHPNFDLFLWILLIVFMAGGIGKIILGCLGEEKDQHYGLKDVIDGLFWVIVVVIVLIT